MRLFCLLVRSFATVVSVACAVAAAHAGEGEVITTMDSAGYTYIEVRLDGKTDWLASEPVKVSVGQRIRFEEFSMMTNFRSESLFRTFPVMRFVNDVKVLSATPMPATSAPVKAQ